MDRLDAMAVFVSVAEAGSFSRASKSLGAPLTTVSRKVAQLEERLGARLFVRTTRRLGLTEKGSEYLERCKRILGDLEEAEAALADDLSTPSGRLIISAPVLFGRMYLAPLLVPFIARQRASPWKYRFPILTAIWSLSTSMLPSASAVSRTPAWWLGVWACSAVSSAQHRPILSSTASPNIRTIWPITSA